MGFVPPHWKRAGGEKWDKGYAVTAYFLEWIEKQKGKGTIRKLNAFMKDSKYDPKIFVAVAGDAVDDLWSAYRLELECE